MPARNPFVQMTKAELAAHLQKEFAAEHYFTGVLGNRPSVFLTKPTRRKKSSTRRSARRRTKTTR